MIVSVAEEDTLVCRLLTGEQGLPMMPLFEAVDTSESRWRLEIDRLCLNKPINSKRLAGPKETSA